jgi:SAM-dependent methyltransferase
MSKNMSENIQPVRDCPICGQHTFSLTTIKYNVTDILKRWEEELLMTFQETVWNEYAEPNKNEVSLYECASCAYKMFLPPLVGSESFYSDIMSNWSYQEEKWEFFRTIELLSKDSALNRILDFGCGSGFFLDLLCKSRVSGEFNGYEINPAVADLARSKGHTIFSGKFPEIFSDVLPFNVVCAFQVLEHLDEPVKFLLDVKNIIATGGLLIIGVPNASGPIRHFSNSITELPPHHISRWSEIVFSNGMERLGFSIVKIKTNPSHPICGNLICR